MWLAAVGMFYVARMAVMARRDVFVVHLTNNPDKFFLERTNSGFSYSFTYDPLAADQWLFQFGRGDTERVVTQQVAGFNPK